MNQMITYDPMTYDHDSYVWCNWSTVSLQCCKSRFYRTYR